MQACESLHPFLLIINPQLANFPCPLGLIHLSHPLEIQSEHVVLEYHLAAAHRLYGECLIELVNAEGTQLVNIGDLFIHIAVLNI